MKTFLLWRHGHGRRYPPTALAAARMAAIFDPFYREPPPVETRAANGASLLYQELPVKGWTRPFIQEDESRWVLAIDYPIDADAVTARTRGGRPPLPALCAMLEREPRRLLHDLSPPFSLIWHNKRSDSFYAVCDGLGFAKLYEYRRGPYWALTNRISAFAALDLPLEPDLDMWMARWALNWFPLNRSGFKNVRSAEPGTRFRITDKRVSESEYDVLGDWLTPQDLSPEDCLEQARWAMHEYLQRAVSHLDEVTVGLSGGWDSRPVAATLLGMGVPFTAQVRGEDWRPDVLIAKELCEIAGIPLKHRRRHGVPKTNTEALHGSIINALIWQSGFLSRRHHHTFQGRGRGFGPGTHRVTGRCGEIARTYILDRYGRRDGDRLPTSLFAETSMEILPPFVRSETNIRVRQILFDEFNQAERYGLADDLAWQFCVLQRAARSIHQRYVGYAPGVTIIPYLHPDIVKAAFSLPISMLCKNPVHSHIVASWMPRWAQVEYEKAMTKRLKVASTTKLAPGLTASEANKLPESLRPSGAEHYNKKLFWHEYAAPMMEQTLREDGMWTEVFDPKQAREDWRKQPEELAIMAQLPQTLAELARRARNVDTNLR